MNIDAFPLQWPALKNARNSRENAIINGEAEVLPTPLPPLTARSVVTRGGLMPTLQIPLTQNKYALIDAEDLDLVSGWTWSASKYGRTFYAKCSVRADGRQTSVKMHRLIMGADEGEAVDHINGDGLDNRRCNLRLASKSQNGQNQANCRTHSSRYKGVSWDKQTGRWRSKIQCDGMTFHLGRFHSEIEAARAYDSAALELFGDYARLNFSEVDHA